MSKFDEFLRDIVSDCVEGGSGDWPKDAPRVGDVVAAEVRARDWRDVNSSPGDYEGLDFSKRPCIHCGRSRRLDDDGWCAECDQHDPAYEAELQARAQAEAPQRYRAIAADWRARGMTEQADELDAYVDGLEAKGKAS